MNFFKSLSFLFLLLMFTACEEDPGLGTDPENTEEEEIFVPKVYEGNIELLSYEDLSVLRDFQKDSFNVINGNLQIVPSNDISVDTLETYLGYLFRLVEIQGYCTITSDKITDLDFMPKLKYIASRLSIDCMNAKVISFPKFKQIDHNIDIIAESLELLDFPAFTSFGEDAQGSSILIQSTGVEGCMISCPSLKSVYALMIYACPEIEVLAFDSLQYANAIDLRSCNSIESFEGMPNLQAVESITLDNCEGIKDLTGFENVEYLEMMWVKGCTSLKSFRGLENVSRINYSLTISRNTSLNDYCDLQPAVFMRDGLYVSISGNGYNPTKEDLASNNCSN